MTGPSRPVQEGELHAYVDDRQNAARRAEVESHFRATPALLHRVKDWRQQAEALRDAMVFRLHESVPASLHLGCLLEQRDLRRRRGLFGSPWRVVAAMLLMVSLGATSGWMARGAQCIGELPMARCARQELVDIDRKLKSPIYCNQ
jgi:anti-sigma factor RsiW